MRQGERGFLEGRHDRQSAQAEVQAGEQIEHCRAVAYVGELGRRDRHEHRRASVGPVSGIVQPRRQRTPHRTSDDPIKRGDRRGRGQVEQVIIVDRADRVGIERGPSARHIDGSRWRRALRRTPSEADRTRVAESRGRGGPKM
jgi:hypothetical protein